MNNFLHTLQQQETDAANLFIKNSQTLANGDKIELARELTDLRVQLRETQEKLEEVNKTTNERWDEVRRGSLLDYFLLALFSTTLILLGISYIFT
tara:strand:- start:9988 stop:10272 length:285 start_codon:yes stop_codon:yes gene_type:complete